MILYRRTFNVCRNVLRGWCTPSCSESVFKYSFMPDFTNYCFYELNGRVFVNKKFDDVGWFVHRELMYTARLTSDPTSMHYGDIEAFIQQRNLQIHTKTLNIIRKFELLSKL